nr:sodium/calcium exchanger NCL2-like [Tanacetum cinerariifolium]
MVDIWFQWINRRLQLTIRCLESERIHFKFVKLENMLPTNSTSRSARAMTPPAVVLSITPTLASPYHHQHHHQAIVPYYSYALATYVAATNKPWERWIRDGVDRSFCAWTKAIMLLMLETNMLAAAAISAVQTTDRGKERVTSVKDIGTQGHSKCSPYSDQETTNEGISHAVVTLLTELYVDVTAHTAPSQQAVSLPLQGMEVWDILIMELMLSSREGVFIERGKSRVASRLTDFSESEEDLSSDPPEHGAALDVRSAAKERRKEAEVTSQEYSVRWRQSCCVGRCEGRLEAQL